MASVKGFVQELKITPDYSVAWIYVGPSPLYTEVFFVEFDEGMSETEAVLATNMVNTLASCLAERREVEILHGANNGRITTVIVHPI
jgi:hypothetical protein